MFQEKQKMSNRVNKLIIPIIIIVVLAAGVVLFFAFKGPAPSEKTLYVLWTVHVEGDTQECQIGQPCCKAGFYQEKAFELIDVQGLEILQSLSENHIDSFGGYPKMYLSPAGEFIETEMDSQYGGKAFRKYDWLALGHEIGPQPHMIYWSGEKFCWPTREMSKEGIIKKLTTLHQWAEKWYHNGQKVNHGLTYAPGMKLELPIFGKDLAAKTEAEKFIDKEAYNLGYRISMEDWDAYVEDNPALGQRIPYLYQANYDDGTTMYKIGFQGAVTSSCTNPPRCETPQNAKAWIDYLIKKMEADPDPSHLYYYAFATHPYNPPPPENYLRGEEIRGAIQVFEYLDELVKSWVKIKYITPKDFIALLKEPLISEPPATTTQSPYQDSPFGMHYAFYRPFLKTGEQPDLEKIANTKDPYKETQNIGVRWDRLGIVPAASQFPPYDWTLRDKFYSSVPEGISILPNIWVRETPFIKPGTWQFKDESAKQAYIEFVKALVERYDGDGKNDMPGLKNPIKYWQVENEPVINNLMHGQELNLDWEGFAGLMKVSYEVIKASDPEAKVLIGGTIGGEALYIDAFSQSIFWNQINEFYSPVLKKLQGNYIDIFDIHYYGEAEGSTNWHGSKEVYDLYRNILDENGYKNAPIWFTESGSPSRVGLETLHARDVIKRYVYPLSYGVKKVFWAFGFVEGYPPLTGTDYFDHTGLIYDGIGEGDPGYGVKKLSYYTYKKMVEILDGSDWSNIQKVQESDGIYIYKFNKQGKSIWVAWNDNTAEKTIAISNINSGSVKITEAIPKYESGKEVTDYNAAFNTETKSVSGGKIMITLKDKPVFVEEK